MPISRTVVISCAGMGKRLGMDTTKALVRVDGVPLIIRHLRMLDDVDDVRVVVGYQAERVIECVRQYRNDVTFVFNHEYMHNGTGASVMRAVRFAGDYILTLDGDLLIHPSDMRTLLEQEGEFIGVTAPGSDGPVLTDVDGGMVTEFSREHGTFEWTGVMQVRTDRLTGGEGHVYQLIEQYLPMPYLYIRTKEIDTVNDFDNAERWVKNGYSEERGMVLGIVGADPQATLDAYAQVVGASAGESCPRVLVDAHASLPDVTRALDWGERCGELVELVAQSARTLVSSGAQRILLVDDGLMRLAPQVVDLVPEAEGLLVGTVDELVTAGSEA